MQSCLGNSSSSLLAWNGNREGQTRGGKETKKRNWNTVRIFAKCVDSGIGKIGIRSQPELESSKSRYFFCNRIQESEYSRMQEREAEDELPWQEFTHS